jgi:hypothetical protein
MKLLRTFHALLAVAGVALASSAARAVIDVTEVEIEVSIEGVNEAGAEAQRSVLARVVVRGSGITAATLTPPGSTTAVSLPLVSGEFVLEQSFADATGLDAVLPDGDYLLQVESGSETAAATLPYERPEVPSPAISQPAHRSTVRAGSVTAVFEPCAICNLTEDTTVGTLEQNGTTLASETLAKGTATDWVPSDDEGPLSLPESSAFTLEVAHTASRSAAVTASPTDPFTFRSIFSRSDEVQFSTGFLPPEGSVCLVVNDPDELLHAADETCTIANDSLRGILDVSGGSFSAVAAGVPIEYGLSLSPGGRLSGIVDADLDGDGAFETHVPLQGRLRGSAGRLRQTLRFALEGAPDVPATSLRISILERALLTDGVKTRKLATKGDLLGAPVSETRLDAESIASLPTAWRLDFALVGEAGRISGATLTLPGATPALPNRTVDLTGRHRFSFEFDRTNVRLRSRGGDKGVEIDANGLRFHEAGTISRGEIRWRAFGQGGRLRFRDG